MLYCKNMIKNEAKMRQIKKSSYAPSAIESKWQAKWENEKTYQPQMDSAKKPYYNLMMFPYPSAEGLHIGGVRTFGGVDIYGTELWRANDFFRDD